MSLSLQGIWKYTLVLNGETKDFLYKRDNDSVFPNILRETEVKSS